MGFIAFMGSQAGRAVRIAAGLGIMALGHFTVAGTAGWVLMAVGVLPLAAGVFDFCLFAPLFGRPFGGKALRASTAR
jgi:hypothetical protein